MDEDEPPMMAILGFPSLRLETMKKIKDYEYEKEEK